MCWFQVMTNEHTFKSQSGNKRRTKDKLTYTITLQWRYPMNLNVVQFKVDTYYPGANIVPVWN